LKALHVIPPVKFGGGESILHALMTMGIDKGHDERICCLYKSSEFERVLDKSAVPFYRLSDIDLGSGPSRIRSKMYSLSLLLRLPKLLRIIRSVKPDVVHLHGFPSILLGAMIKPMANGVPMVYTHHWVSAPKGVVERWIFDRLFVRMNFVTGVSDASLQSLLRDHAALIEKSAVVNNFASKDFFVVGTNRILPEASRRNDIRFVNVARFAPFKNQIAVVNAVAQLDESERARIKVVFVGEGETLAQVKARVEELALCDCFEFKGFVPHAEVAKILSNADVMVFPSHNEGSPIAIAEALAAGLPVLGLKHCAPVVEVASSAGVFVEESELADGLRKFLNLDINELSQKALQRAQSFDPEVIKRQYLDIYQQIVSAA
jgi:glycosyltransferase involved in cell wall biosynthesis